MNGMIFLYQVDSYISIYPQNLFNRTSYQVDTVHKLDCPWGSSFLRILFQDACPYELFCLGESASQLVSMLKREIKQKNKKWPQNWIFTACGNKR